jgi:CheY-like chemotaxis protein
MNGILGMTQLLLDTDLTTDQLDMMRTVRMSSESLLTIINDILDFSKVEAGKMVLEPIAFDLYRAVFDVVDLLSPKARDKGLHLAVRIEPDSPHHVIGDPGRLRQILLNLAGNAIKFTDTGHVLLELGGTAHDADRGHIILSVHDTGIGMDEQAKKGLFRSFSQADASTTRRFGGTGLGLAISKRLITLMGGRIDVTSVPGEGSTFTCVLDLPMSHKQEPLANIDLRGCRMLIVDDDEVSRTILLEQLRLWDTRPEVVTRSEEAMPILLKAVSAEPFEFVITNSHMPGLSGDALGKAIRREPMLADIKLIMMTSTQERGDAPRLATIGFSGYLVKPAYQDDLRAVLEVVHAGTHREIVTRHSVSQGGQGPGSVLPETTPSFADRRLLLVEDNVVNQKFAKMMLSKLGCKVDLVANGKEAVDLFRQLSYDLVLMDCQIPEVDGFKATARIRADEGEGRRTPIVAMTANAMPGDRARCLDAGMDGYISKPVSSTVLSKTLALWLSEQASPRRHGVTAA